MKKISLHFISPLSLLAILIASCSPMQTPTPLPTPSEGPSNPLAVKVWLTTSDQSSLLARQPDLMLEKKSPAGQIIYVNENNRYQQMEGFGAAMTDSSAWLIYTQLTPAQRAGVMSALFSPADGIGISAMRVPMGASDFVHGDPYTYDDQPSGQTDPELAHFSIEHDKAYIIPAIQDALKINPNIKIIASPWSPPAWMKDSDALGNGTLQSKYYAAFAQYFVKFIQAYQAQNIPIYAITIQNEPHFEPKSYPGMRLEPQDEAELVKNHLGPAFAAAGLKTRILVWDHNWNEWKYPIEVLDDPQAKAFIGGAAFHCYAGTVLGQGLVHDAYPDVDLYFTECSSGAWIPNFGETLKQDTKNLTIGATRNWARTVIKWNLALDKSFGPHTGGCGNCYGVVTIDPASESGFTPNYDYYTIGQASKFVQQGAYRVASSSFQFDNLESAAFKNPDGSNVLIVSNFSSGEKAFTISWGEQSFSYTLPSGSVATFAWDGTQKNPAAPTPPTNLAARAYAGKLVVNWDFSSLAETYTLKRAEQAGGPYTVLASDLSLPEYMDSDISAGKTYYYVVSAANSLGASPDSAEANVAP